MIQALEIEQLQSEVGELERMLEEMPEEYAVGRFSLERRLDEVKQRLASLEGTPLKYAEAALMFGGKPVVGSLGIDADFGPAAVSRFQQLVRSILSEKRRGDELKASGRLPETAGAQLRITNMLRGSVGFELKELATENEKLFPSELIEIADEAMELITAAATSEEDFDEVVAGVNERVLAQLKEFFKILNSNEATLRIIVGDRSKALDRSHVEAAAARTGATRLREETKQLTGMLEGVLPEGHKFEFRTDEETITGKVDKELDPSQLLQWNRLLAGRACRATVVVKEVERHNKITKKYRLIDVEPLDSSP